jgi:exodeoxyribonuclease (lambda-induced)
MTIIWCNDPQGSDEWLAARRGAITGSRAKDARDRLKNGSPGSKMLTYAMDTAREREGGQPLAQGQNTAMRIGTEQEPIARMKYEAFTGELVEEVGFAHTHDGRFGCSLDGRVGPNGAIEVKTLVGSTSLFAALVDGDISEYRDQCLMAMWLLTLDWVDVVLWAPDLDLLRVVRVNRDEEEIAAFEADMLLFDRLVENYRAKLRGVMAVLRGEDELPEPAQAPAAPTPQATTQLAPLEPAF